MNTNVIHMILATWLHRGWPRSPRVVEPSRLGSTTWWVQWCMKYEEIGGPGGGAKWAEYEQNEKINNNYSSATPINNMTNNKINKKYKNQTKTFENTQN